MTDRDRLRILADQGDPIAIGQLYREAKRRGESVVCVSPARQDLTAPPPPADEWAWLEPHVVGWAEQIGCRFDRGEWERTRSLPAQGFDGGGGWHEVTASIRLLRPRRAYQPHIKGMQWVGVFTATVIARIDAATGERSVQLEGQRGIENLTPWLGDVATDSKGTVWSLAGVAAIESIVMVCDWFVPLAKEGEPCNLPLSDDVLTATGRDLDRLGHDIHRMRRNPGESDASFRERLLVREWSAPR